MSLSGNVVTVTLAGDANYAAGAPVLIANSGIAGDDGAFTIHSGTGGSNTFTYIDNNAGAASEAVAGGTATVVGGAGSLVDGAANERSMVDSISYTFSRPVNLGANAFTLAAATITSGPSGNPLPTLEYASPDGGYTWVLTFTGPNTEFNSILDGAYQISLNGAAVSPILGGGSLSSNDSETFYRLYGDGQGVAATGGKVNTTDYANLINAINMRDNSSGFIAWADIDGGTKIDTTDYATFLNYINLKFVGFNPSI